MAELVANAPPEASEQSRRPVADWRARGWPVEYRGVVDAAPGLFFCGLSFQFAFSSMIFPGIGRDADFVAQRITERIAQRASTRPRSASVAA